MQAPPYRLSDLIAACKAWVEATEAAEDRGGKGPPLATVIEVWSKARAEAGYFDISGPGVASDVDIVTFIANDGLEDPFYVPADELVSNTTADIPKKPVASGFYTGKKCGYIAFYRDPTTGAWVIKSFKKNKDTHKQKVALKRPGPKTTH